MRTEAYLDIAPQLVEQEKVAQSEKLDGKCWDAFAIGQLCDDDVCLGGQWDLRWFSFRNSIILMHTLAVDETKHNVDQIRVLIFKNNLARCSLL